LAKDVPKKQQRASGYLFAFFWAAANVQCTSLSSKKNSRRPLPKAKANGVDGGWRLAAGLWELVVCGLGLAAGLSYLCN
jgi:hypothetical protein